MAKTPIQWAAGCGDGREGHSINPLRAQRQIPDLRSLDPEKTKAVTGHHCTKISGACKYCYSSRMQSRFNMPDFTAGNRALVGLFLDESKLQEVLRRKKPTGYFWCDMTDMFLDDYPFEWIDQIFATMALTPQHVHMVLTKRPERMKEYFDDARCFNRVFEVAVGMGKLSGAVVAGMRGAMWLKNVYLGVSAEDQQTYVQRWPILRDIPAAVRFLSIEPLLGPVLLQLFSGHPVLPNWVIVGGESGSPRTMDIDWVRAIAFQCKQAAVPVFVKQLGRNPIQDGLSYALDLDPGHGGNWDEWPEEIRIREWPNTA